MSQLGYDPHNTMVVGIPLHNNTYMKWEKRAAYFHQLRESVAEIPGVISAAISTEATPPMNGVDEQVEIMGRRVVEEQQIRLSMVSPVFLHAPCCAAQGTNLGRIRVDAGSAPGGD